MADDERCTALSDGRRDRIRGHGVHIIRSLCNQWRRDVPDKRAISRSQRRRARKRTRTRSRQALAQHKVVVGIGSLNRYRRQSAHSGIEELHARFAIVVYYAELQIVGIGLHARAHARVYCIRPGRATCCTIGPCRIVNGPELTAYTGGLR